ncbi:MAG: calcium/sodium antiporter [bacterium]|nr:calcium/sodium antiporter [bacterium]
MITHFLLIAVGILALYFGAIYLVEGARGLALRAGMSTFAVAATVVALGTSCPELVVTLIAAVTGSSEVALGNVIGSNIANLALVLGLSCLFLELVVPKSLQKVDYPFLLALTGLLYIQSFDGTLGRFDGFILALVCAGYLHYTVTSPHEAGETTDTDLPTVTVGKSWGLTVIGIIVVLVGAKLLVSSGIAVARYFGVREIVIGLTLVAVGTSLPELATSVVAAFKRDSDITVGNVVGSNIINIGMALGLVSMVRPIPIPHGTTEYEFPVLLIVTIIPWLIIRRYGTIPRWAAAGILMLYGFFVLSLPYVRGAA